MWASCPHWRSQSFALHCCSRPTCLKRKSIIIINYFTLTALHFLPESTLMILSLSVCALHAVCALLKSHHDSDSLIRIPICISVPIDTNTYVLQKPWGRIVLNLDKNLLWCSYCVLDEVFRFFCKCAYLCVCTYVHCIYIFICKYGQIFGPKVSLLCMVLFCCWPIKLPENYLVLLFVEYRCLLLCHRAAPFINH